MATPATGAAAGFWDYAVHSGCHWVVNFNLRLAELVEPKRPWRIVTTQKHSTVWDGAETLFDINFLALGVHPDEAGSGPDRRPDPQDRQRATLL